MKRFTGFPAKMKFTPLPNLFFSALLPQISDLAELKTTLYIFTMLYHKRGYPRFVSFGELLGNVSLRRSLGEVSESSDEALRKALAMVTARGIFLHLVLDRDGSQEDIYFLNTESDRQTVAKIQSGDLVLGGLEVKEQTYVEMAEQPNVFTLYEENIGMLTPIIAEELREAEKSYPVAWIRDAIKEAVNQGKHKWSYVSAILERWASEGRSDGAYQRDLKPAGPDKYRGQRYGHMVRR